jgi:hypothetical protein
LTVPYFSSEQTDPDVRAAHRALERLSYLAQELVAGMMAEAVELDPATARELAWTCRSAVRRLWRFRSEE